MRRPSHKVFQASGILFSLTLLLFVTVAPLNGVRAIENYIFRSETISLLSGHSPVSDTSHADFDGPYIFYRGDTTFIKQILKRNKECYVRIDTSLSSIKGIKITCHVNDTIQFSTHIKSSLKNEKPSYSAADKLMAISDIEGNFIELRNLLINNQVMNADYQWTFGTGHLVLVGDFFDRGLHVTECLWLIYHLEQEAIKSKGYVHFILGNHEIMNMNEDIRYVRNKYIENASFLNENYSEFYTPETELGRWLQTKNIAEKIGSYMFLHGGLSKEMHACKATIQNINAAARKYYYRSDEAVDTIDVFLATLYSGNYSPFWYRGYINGTMEENALDTIIKEFYVRRIVVGHSIVKDVRYFYNKKVIGIDTKHAEGDSEGLLIEEGIEYRIDGLGKRYPIE